VLLAGPLILAAIKTPGATDGDKIIVCVVSGIVSLITGIVAAFGLKRSV
jgi:hypothetical protein